MSPITARDIARLNEILDRAKRRTVSLEEWIGGRAVRGSGLSWLTLATVDRVAMADLGGVVCETCGCTLDDHIEGKPCSEPLAGKETEDGD